MSLHPDLMQQSAIEGLHLTTLEGLLPMANGRPFRVTYLVHWCPECGAPAYPHYVLGEHMAGVHGSVLARQVCGDGCEYVSREVRARA